MGPLCSNDKNSEALTMSTNHLPENALEKRVQKFWSTESFGTELNETSPRSIEDRRALDFLENMTSIQ